ncbi:Gfo/Idh/MocA family protein [Nodosilinea sp. PGN35]|uniref:Gfo/Idh/MocA family protein n=1 Tax=Nodosilinea sp. PGN35 TaxID=3020489 RepID=UPI0023B224C2|nr:Gfo/Idh/MocA family oxidoreductase [Nodosilinea sp. TSF1-S3]MDF0367331.1 Gfo/Idh/MocA family oxidoreductase [Nodosilinea sp. TSF1-S3]
MQNSPVRIGLVGCGAVSQLYYSPALKELENLGLVQVNRLFDPSEASLASLKSTFPRAISVSCISNFSRDVVDLIILASPPQYHAQQAIQLLEAGLSVLCEKPMANTVAEAEAIIAAAAQAEGVLAVGLFRRFFPATQAIQRIISSGMLGELQSFECYEGGQFHWPVQSPNYFKRSHVQGGVLLDIGVHLLDLLIWWFGEPKQIQYEDDAMGGIDVNCRLACQFAEVAGTVRLSRDCDLPGRYIIKGRNAWLSWTVNEADNVQLGLADSGLGFDTKIHHLGMEATLPVLSTPAFNFEQSFTSQICNVIAAMKGQAPLMVPASEGIRSLRWIEHCYHHRTLMAMPWLSPAELSRAQQLSLIGE